ncbi:Ca2+-modulated nonselective cation channel polycystin [Zymoseptoria tritici IPO323]|uniref:Ca2+-modulated nonselective cation channel polycystin n=1 Tax=Zymoseptoria tritici (strain CBS 115943 / IPO323) TaxID=336722 RepID=F9XN82_ZYMTI|nr:Ca2+-modulated nonselective cation channel polycystin [Zymoseptoria tritici IPO323]EGP83561.1 Ca2+-modulated nonselective cation channel polycystin [Zymoseptoria tritici IPO323]
MHFQPLLLLLGTALANPLAQLQERQAPAAPVYAAAVGRCQATPTLRNCRQDDDFVHLDFHLRRSYPYIHNHQCAHNDDHQHSDSSFDINYHDRHCQAYSHLPTSEAATTTPEQSAVTTPEQSGVTSSAGPEIATSVGFETVTTAATPEQTTGAPETTAAGQQKRQVVRPSVKPACLTALNAVATTNACRCIIPASTTTRTTTLRSTVTATRTIVTTRRTVSTVTSSPVTTITTGALLTRTVTTTITSINRVAATVTSTVAYELAATPTAFVLMDRLQAPDAAVAQWATNGADNETSHNIEYALTRNQPSVFSFNAWNELHVAGWGDDEGTDFTVVGQEQEGDGVQMAALDSDDGSQAAKCSIQVTAEGLCPVRCTVGDNAVNSQM